MRILVLGTGYVASAYVRSLLFLGYSPFILSRAWFDYRRISDLVRHYDPDVVINAAGWTGQTIDECETTEGRTRAYHANVTLAYQVRKAVEQTGAKLIHISTGCLFQGPGPYKENDTPNNGEWWPSSSMLKNAPAYIQTKWQAEQDMLDYQKAFIFRIRMPFNHVWHPRNLLVKLSQYPQILDGFCSLTFLDEFCMRSWNLICKEKAQPGVYHVAYPGIQISKVAQMLHDAGIRTLPVELYPPDKFMQDGHVRRSEAVLDSSKFETAFGAPFGDIVCALRWCIDRMKETRPSSRP